MSEITAEILNQVIPVHVTNQPRDKTEYFCKSTHRTVILTATTPVLELVSGPDPARKEIIIVANDAPVVVGDYSQATSPDNQVTGLPSPRGTLVPQNQPVAFESGSELYAACPLTGANVNRIGIITVHETRP